VDTDQEHLARCAALLRGEGFEVVAASSDLEVERALRAGAPVAALVDDEQRAVAPRLREIGAPVFGMTDLYLGGLNREIAILRDGYVEYWEKPLVDGEVLGWLRRVLGDQYPEGQELDDADVEEASRAAPPLSVEKPSPAIPRAAMPTPLASHRSEAATGQANAVPPPRLGARRPTETTVPAVATPASGSPRLVSPPLPRPTSLSSDFPQAVDPVGLRATGPLSPASGMPRLSVRPEDSVPNEADRTAASVADGFLVPPRLDVRDVPLAGDLRDRSFPTVLAWLAYTRATGALMLRLGEDKRLFYLEEGFAVSARSNVESETLGQLIVSGGLLSAPDVRRYEGEAATQRTTLQAVLRQRTVFSPDELDLLWSVLLRNKTLDVFRWESGEYAFREGSVPRNFRHDPVISPMDLIWEGVQHGTPLTMIRRELDGHLGHRLVWINDPPEPESIRMTPGQTKLLARIDNEASMHTLSRAGLVTEDGQRLLFVLTATGFLGFEP